MIIYKYALPRTHRSTISMPEGAEILHVDNQFDEPFIWAMVDPNRPPVDRKFLFIGTGAEFYETNVKHISTFLVRGDSYVFHIFEIV